IPRRKVRHTPADRGVDPSGVNANPGLDRDYCNQNIAGWNVVTAITAAVSCNLLPDPMENSAISILF
ncbi:MAG: hypothetical protein WB696_30825, partial [Chthoniobacterales bacterium]